MYALLLAATMNPGAYWFSDRIALRLYRARAREFVAHEAAAHIGGNPLALANALRKPEASRRVVPMERADPATAHLFILNPIASGGIVKLFSTHPPTRECITRLEAMAYRRTRATA